MEFVVLVTGIVLLVILYFCFGMMVKLIWGWLPLALGLAIGILMVILGGWAGAAIGIFVICGSVFVTDSWQGTDFFLTVEETIDRKFYLDD